MEKRALAFLLGRFSGRVLRSGEHLVPEAALEALADQNIPFTVKGVVYLSPADKYHRFTRRLSKGQKVLQERALLASQRPSEPW